jgi:hypothetical protein
MRRTLSYLLVSSLTLSGCFGGADEEGDELIIDEPTETQGADPDLPALVGEVDEPFTSSVATLMNVTWNGEVHSTSGSTLTSRRNQIKAQLIYAIGHFNGQSSGPLLHKVNLTNITYTYSGGLYRIRYTAVLPVAWGAKTNLPTSYRLRLPKRADSTGLAAFLNKYGTTCNDGDDGSVTSGNYWYHYRTAPADCSLAPADVLDVTATMAVATGNTTGVYPEYHKVWEDGQLNIVAVFGKYSNGATSNSDAGIAAWNNFIYAVKRELPGATTFPANVPDAPGYGITDVTFRAMTPAGRVTVVALLVDEVQTSSTAWNTRYAEVTPMADIIAYNGHAGLGANARSLANKGKFFPKKYTLFFMNGCDTFSYSDAAVTLANIRAALNPDDPNGTKFMDFLSNAMPAYFNDMSDASMALIRALRYPGSEKTFNQILSNVDGVQVVVATGEEDNRYTTVYDPGVTWNGFEAEGGVAKSAFVNYQTEVLPAGKYAITLSPQPGAPGGDADLYVRAGTVPAQTSTYKCPSYHLNSNEFCSVTLTSPAALYFVVKGDKLGVTSQYVLNAYQLPQ